MIEYGIRFSKDETASREYGRRLAAFLQPGDVVALVGELGAGKTRFAQGLAVGLGVPPAVPVTSPTFTLLIVYSQGRLPFNHFDFYRIEKADELVNIGAEEYLWGEGVCAVEWAERFPSALPEETLWVTFRFCGEGRELVFGGRTERWRSVLDALPEVK